jgi:predicted peptidase
MIRIHTFGLLLAAGPLVAGWQSKTFEDGKSTLRYFLSRPESLQPGTKVPLIVFMHGGGPRKPQESPNDSSKFLVEDALQKKYPSFVIAPQLSSGRCWSNHGYGEGNHSIDASPTEPLRLVLELISKIGAELPIDTDRIYLIGVSNGGYAAWDMLARRPELFAAAAPMEGGGDPKQASKMAKVPLWAEHGKADKVVPCRGTREMVEAVRAAGGTVRFLEHDEGHGSWTKLLSDPAFFEWLFAQHRGASPPEKKP